MPDSIISRLLRLDACSVSDAMDKLALSGCVTGLLPLSCQKKIAGRVQTVKLVRKEDAQLSGPPRHLGAAAIVGANPGDIIVVEQKTGLDAGSWGGLLSTGAKMRGIAGVIADGPVRDVDEARQLEFPVYARRTTARTARNRIVEAATNGPVTVGDVTVEAGDYALADGSAVLFIRAADAERVLAEAEMIARREGLMAKALMEGKPITEVMGADYEHMLR